MIVPPAPPPYETNDGATASDDPLVHPGNYCHENESMILVYQKGSHGGTFWLGLNLSLNPSTYSDRDVSRSFFKIFTKFRILLIIDCKEPFL